MEALKGYTNFEQSKKLAEILPLESADMHYLTYSMYEEYCDEIVYTANLGKPGMYDKCCIPCWSLAALLEVLPKKCYPIKDHKTTLILGKPKDKWCALYWDTTGMQDGEQTLADNPVDACYEMILRLHELKSL